MKSALFSLLSSKGKKQPRVINDWSINRKQNENTTQIFPNVNHGILAYVSLIKFLG